MSQIEKIESAIIEISPARFQKLGDAFLKRLYSNAQMFVTEGSQFGKEKTVAGSPDTYIETDTENIFVEYSTNISSKINKLINDIDKCAEKNSELGSKKSPLIILITNFKLNLNEQAELRKHSESKGCYCDIMDGPSFTHELYANHRDLISDFLELSIDTGQIVNKLRFIKEYSNGIGEFACPLNNQFMFRDEEFGEILSYMNDKDFIVITGQPGVGKTKIALEAGERFCKQNSEYTFRCISDKSESLLSDLTMNISQSNKTVLLIDDANRISHFKQIVEFHKSFDEGKLKLLITVRDYALNEVFPILPSGASRKICLGRMNDESIIEILKSSLGIYNKEYLDAIINIAKGSPRLALMAGRIALNTQRLGSLSNLASLFSEYYSPIFARMQNFGSDNLKKALSVLTILGPVNENDSKIKELCSLFRISEQDFHNSLTVLDKLEIVNRYSSGFIKIAEQNFGFFIFHSEVVEKNSHIIDNIFTLCFEDNAHHLKENFISVTNLFGIEELKVKVSNGLSSFLDSIHDKDTKIAFLKDYWMLIQEKALAFVASIVLKDNSSRGEDGSYSVNYKNNQFAFESSRDKLLDFISNSFYYGFSNLDNMIRLAIKYVTLNPELAPQLSWHIENSFGITIEDINIGMYRHNELLNILNEGMNNNNVLERKLFWKHLSLFLKTEHNYTHSTYRKNKIRIYNLSVGDCESALELHNIIWRIAECHFNSDFFRESIETISFYGKKGSRIPSLDAKAICRILENNASPSGFTDCWLVDKFAWRVRHIRSLQSEIKLLKQKFHNKQFEFYTNLNWNYLYGKHKDFCDYKTHHIRKEKELGSIFTFNTTRKATFFFKRFLLLWNLKYLNKDELSPSLCSIVCLNLKSDFRVGAHLLNLALSAKTDINLYPILYEIIDGESTNKLNQIQTIKNIILKNQCENTFGFIVNFYEIVPIDYLHKTDCEIILSQLDKVKDGMWIHLNPTQLIKMDSLVKGWFNSFICHVYAKNQEGCKISMGSYYMANWYNSIDDIDMKEKTYLQQLKVTEHFDYERKLLQELLLSRPSFIIDFAKATNASRENQLGKIIWTIPNIEESITYIIKRIERWILSSEHFAKKWESVFFAPQGKEEYESKIRTFIMKFFKESEDKDQPFRIARIFSYHLYEELVLRYVDSSTVEEFMNIDWARSSY